MPPGNVLTEYIMESNARKWKYGHIKDQIAAGTYLIWRKFRFFLYIIFKT